jgi:beta-N-acetylhexosaminidase
VLAELTAAALLASPTAPAALPERLEAGRSVLGRRIVAVRRGSADAPVRLLVTGSIHGTEPAGIPVIARLRELPPPPGVQVWTVRAVNPDGLRRRSRQNVRGVDLNRNFPHRWRGGGEPFDGYYPGRRAASEPEARALMRLVRRIRPAISIHFHQDFRMVNLTGGPDPGVVRAYARRVKLPARYLPRLRGTVTGWQNHNWPGTSAFVVELAAGRLTARGVDRHARAVLAAGADEVARAGAGAITAARPPITWSPIPFGADRRRQMRAYTHRHYGLGTVRLREPRVIVQHFTASSTFGPAFNTFAANRRDVELHERPGVCTHFIVDRDGIIHQLVRLRWMCRHTIGLNHRSFGIEHVGTSDADVLSRRRQLEASLRLTAWLQDRYDIPTEDVIGHAESLSSPYHSERVAALRRRTHGDFGPATMRAYRARLGALEGG